MKGPWPRLKSIYLLTLDNPIRNLGFWASKFLGGVGPRDESFGRLKGDIMEEYLCYGEGLVFTRDSKGLPFLGYVISGVFGRSVKAARLQAQRESEIARGESLD